MPQGIIARLPDLSAVLAFRQNAELGFSSVTASLDGAASGQPGSLLASVANTIGGLRAQLNIDVSGLAQRFPAALATISNAVPAGTVEHVRALGDAYIGARDFLANTPLAREAAASQSLQATALATIATALDTFRTRQVELAGRIIDPAILTRVRDSFQAIERFRTGFAANQADFLPFLSRHLLGLEADVLRAPMLHLDASFSVFAALETASLETALGPAQRALDQAFGALADRLATFDPGNNAAYAQLEALLRSLEAAVQTLRTAAGTLYAQLQAAVDSHAWDNVFGGLEPLLRALTVRAPFSVDELVGNLSTILNDLLVSVQSVLSPGDVGRRIEALGQLIRETFNDSPLGQVRQALRDFLERIRQAIEAVPTEQVQQTVEQMLARIGEEVDALGLDEIATAIETKFREAETFITGHINAALGDGVREALAGLLRNLRAIPVSDLGNALETVLGQLRGLIAELEQALAGALGQVSQFLQQLEDVSFTPVADEVIGEIDGIKEKLRAMNPNALGEVEKQALCAALAVLQSIDLEEQVIRGLKDAFAQAGQGLKSLLDDLTGVLDRLRQQVETYQPAMLLESLTQVVTRAKTLAESLNGRALLRPLYEQVEAAARGLEALSPGTLLDPLQPPYQTMLGAVEQLNPAAWLAPLNDLYAAIDRLIGMVDVTPLLEELDRRRRSLLTDARTALLTALENLNAPEPIPAFLGTVRPFVEAITETLFGDPDQGLRQIGLDLRSRVKLSMLLDPLDRVFDQVTRMAASVPPAALTDALNALRRDIGVALEVLDPRCILEKFRAGRAVLAELAPNVLLGLPLAVPALQADFEERIAASASVNVAGVASVRARFDAVGRLTAVADPASLYAPWQAQHAALLAAIRTRINSLKPSGVASAYAELRRSTERLVPEFLRRSKPLTHEDAMAGLESLRPSRHAVPLDRLVDDFLQKLAPIQAAITGPTDNFFRSIREVLQLVDPLSIRDAVTAIYDAIRQKVRILDPMRLADQIRQNVFDPLRDTLRALDPAQLEARLEAAFRAVVDALTRNVRSILDEIATAVDEQLRGLRELLTQLVEQIGGLTRTALAGVQEVLDRVEALVFVEVLERLRQISANLEASFARELDRVRGVFDDMLAAIPCGGGPVTVSASVSIG